MEAAAAWSAGLQRDKQALKEGVPQSELFPYSTVITGTHLLIYFQVISLRTAAENAQVLLGITDHK